MDSLLRAHAEEIVRAAIRAVMPDAAVQRALGGMRFSGRVRLVAAGKAAWQMAKAAADCLGSRIEAGVVITKYGHVRGPIANFTCYEGGHPLPDGNSFRATRAALDLVSGLREEDTVLFLLSGGGSAMFEQPRIPKEELRGINERLLASGADIVEINTIRKRLSAVKGGRFARLCAPARIEAVILSDILGDPVDMIASGPVSADPTTAEDARRIAAKYGLTLSEQAAALLDEETPKRVDNVRTQITGSVSALCAGAAEACAGLGYQPILLTDRLCCEAAEAGRMLASVVKAHSGEGRSLAFLAGGETVVRLTGHGLGGRNQELALAAAEGIAGLPGVCVFSVGSDGTDGPTDAAGGYVDGQTRSALRAAGLDPAGVLRENDSYHALKQVGGLIVTGPTGTNVNDVAVALIRRQEKESTG